MQQQAHTEQERARQRDLLRARQVRGLLWLAIAVLIATVCRAGIHEIFPSGWWRVW